MGLDNLDLKGYGSFDNSRKASFIIKTLDLPTSWEYIYQNKKVLLKVDQYGPIYAQANPPSDILFFRRDPFQKFSSWLAWIKSPSFKCKAFTNFFNPIMGNNDPFPKPDKTEISFSPEAAIYLVENEGIRVETEIFVPYDDATVCIKFTLTNLREKPMQLSLVPVLLPYMNFAMLAPWDKPEWYLKTNFCKDKKTGFLTKLLSPNTEKESRRTIVFWSDPKDLSSAEISYEKFAGKGTFFNPEAIAGDKLRMSLSDGRVLGEDNDSNALFGYPPVNALQYDFILAPGEKKSIRQSISLVPNQEDGSVAYPCVAKKMEFTDEKFCGSEKEKLRSNFETMFNVRKINTQDAGFNSYVNDWLPLQMYWVASLDRGWPSGMRGSRDSANDFTAMVATDPKWSRQIIETLMSCQRIDGWYPRQYSALGRKGKHDLRGHVDAGCWVIELLYEYLCFTKDFSILDKKLAWLDSDSENSVLEHAIQTIDFYITDKNIGEHGLCKIGQGDWLDAVNRAGLEGRGESVTVTNQTIIGLVYMTYILEKLKAMNVLPANIDCDALVKTYKEKIEFFKKNLRANAYNKAGYFNSVFNDDGKWIFSDKDPDGERRVYGPANWYSIVSGVAVPDLTESVLKEMDYLKTDMGYRLNYPPMGKIPVDKVGRMGTGDNPAGLFENGNVYNQGSQGFLGRALAVAGKGELLHEVLMYMLPYDQQKHPLSKTMTPPYAVVNCWQQVPGFIHRGGMTFLTGTIAMALRMIYSWMFGIKPMLGGLSIDPCMPSAFKDTKVYFKYLGKDIELEILNPNGAQINPKEILFNGKKIEKQVKDIFSQRNMFVIDDNLFVEKENKIVVKM